MVWPRIHECANIYLCGFICADDLPRRHEGAKKHEGLVQMVWPRIHECANIYLWGLICEDDLPRRHEGRKKHEGLYYSAADF